MHKELRIGIVGLGGICKTRHLPGLAQIPGIRLTAVANRSRASSVSAAREFGIPTICHRWEDLVRRDDVDAVLVGAWPYLHAPVSMAALEAGKHVFCQARMAMNADEARAMLAAATSAQGVAALCPVPIGLSVGKTMARLLNEHALGELRLVQVTSLSGAFADPATPMNWRKDHRLSGLNVLTLGMYLEVIHRWFGPTREVSARTQIFTPEREDAEGQRITVKIPDQVLCNTVLESGIPVHYSVSGVAAAAYERIEIHGTCASLLYDATGDTLFLRKQEGLETPVVPTPEEAYDIENWPVEREFVAAIRDGSAYHPDFTDGLHYMEAVQAVYDSAAHPSGSGAAVIVGDPDSSFAPASRPAAPQ